jgi:EmrB/QacA subfamily drug resistance transporter
MNIGGSIKIMPNEKSKAERLDPAVLRVAFILVVGALAPLLDSTMVNVALHAIMIDMKTNISTIQWITTGYLLAMGLTIPISTWITKQFGCKQSYIFSLILFLIGAVGYWVSWNIGSLMTFRVIQGAGAGLMMPVLQTELVQISGGRNLGKLMSIISIPGLLGPILGPVLGGIIVSSFNWRSMFWIDIPICIVAIPLAVWGIPADKLSKKKVSLDMIGTLLLSLAFTLIIYGIAQFATSEESSIAPLTIGIVLMVAYFIYALNTKRETALDVRLFKSINFSAANILLILSGVVTSGVMLTLPLYYEEVRGASALDAGLWLLSQGIGMLLTRSWFARAADRGRARTGVLLSLAAIAIGTLPFAFAGTDTNYILLCIALLIRGAGLGGLMIVIMTSVYIGLEKEKIPHASTATRIFQNIGGALGTVILVTVIQQQIENHAVSNLHVVSNAFDVSFWVVIGFTLVALIPTLFLATRKTMTEPSQKVTTNKQL